MLEVELSFELPGPQAPMGPEPFRRWLNSDGSCWSEFRRVGADYSIRFPGFADYTVSADGMRVTCRPTHEATDSTLQHLWFNQVRPLALSRQGHLVLHGSAVVLEQQCVAFLGASGQGKSTLAASFTRSGAPFLTDDGLFLFVRGDTLFAAPGHPSIRLWPTTHEALLGPRAAVTSRAQYSEKIRTSANERLVHCDAPQPLRHVFFLGEGTAPQVRIGAIPTSLAFVELLRHSFLLDLSQPETLAAHFDDLTAAARRVVFHTLDYPRRLDALDDVRSAVARFVSDFAAQAKPSWNDSPAGDLQ